MGAGGSKSKESPAKTVEASSVSRNTESSQNEEPIIHLDDFYTPGSGSMTLRFSSHPHRFSPYPTDDTIIRQFVAVCKKCAILTNTEQKTYITVEVCGPPKERYIIFHCPGSESFVSDVLQSIDRKKIKNATRLIASKTPTHQIEIGGRGNVEDHQIALTFQYFEADDAAIQQILSAIQSYLERENKAKQPGTPLLALENRIYKHQGQQRYEFLFSHTTETQKKLWQTLPHRSFRKEIKYSFCPIIIAEEAHNISLECECRNDADDQESTKLRECLKLYLSLAQPNNTLGIHGYSYDRNQGSGKKERLQWVSQFDVPDPNQEVGEFLRSLANCSDVKTAIEELQKKIKEKTDSATAPSSTVAAAPSLTDATGTPNTTNATTSLDLTHHNKKPETVDVQLPPNSGSAKLTFSYHPDSYHPENTDDISASNADSFVHICKKYITLYNAVHGTDIVMQDPDKHPLENGKTSCSILLNKLDMDSLQTLQPLKGMEIEPAYEYMCNKLPDKIIVAIDPHDHTQVSLVFWYLGEAGSIINKILAALQSYVKRENNRKLPDAPLLTTELRNQDAPGGCKKSELLLFHTTPQQRGFLHTLRNKPFDYETPGIISSIMVEEFAGNNMVEESAGNNGICLTCICEDSEELRQLTESLDSYISFRQGHANSTLAISPAGGYYITGTSKQIRHFNISGANQEEKEFLKSLDGLEDVPMVIEVLQNKSEEETASATAPLNSSHAAVASAPTAEISENAATAAANAVAASKPPRMVSDLETGRFFAASATQLSPAPAATLPAASKPANGKSVFSEALPAQSPPDATDKNKSPIDTTAQPSAPSAPK